MQRTASVDWKRGSDGKKGQIVAASGALPDLSYSYASPLGDQRGTHPEELVASAYAGCFTLSLTSALEHLGLRAETLHTEATATLEKDGPHLDLVDVHLKVEGRVPGATAKQFEEAAMHAKKNCPHSDFLEAHITVETKLF